MLIHYLVPGSRCRVEETATVPSPPCTCFVFQVPPVLLAGAWMGQSTWPACQGQMHRRVEIYTGMKTKQETWKIRLLRKWELCTIKSISHQNERKPFLVCWGSPQVRRTHCYRSTEVAFLLSRLRNGKPMLLYRSKCKFSSALEQSIPYLAKDHNRFNFKFVSCFIVMPHENALSGMPFINTVIFCPLFFSSLLLPPCLQPY